MTNNIQGSLDANVLLRLIINDVPEHTTAANKLIASGSSFQIADLAIVETVFVLERYYEISRSEIVIYITVVLSQPKFNLNKILFEQALPLYKNKPKLSFEDCCLAIYARLNKAEPLWTFDKKLALQAESAKLIK